MPALSLWTTIGAISMGMIPHEKVRLLFEFLKIQSFWRSQEWNALDPFLKTLSTRHCVTQSYHPRTCGHFKFKYVSWEQWRVRSLCGVICVCVFFLTVSGCCNFVAFYLCLIFLVTVLGIEFIMITFSIGNKCVKY